MLEIQWATSINGQRELRPKAPWAQIRTRRIALWTEGWYYIFQDRMHGSFKSQHRLARGRCFFSLLFISLSVYTYIYIYLFLFSLSSQFFFCLSSRLSFFLFTHTFSPPLSIYMLFLSLYISGSLLFLKPHIHHSLEWTSTLFWWSQGGSDHPVVLLLSGTVYSFLSSLHAVDARLFFQVWESPFSPIFFVFIVAASSSSFPPCYSILSSAIDL